MITALLSRLVILVFGTLYPAYSSYKAVKTKDLKLYVKWMMYWIVFALFTAAETFTDVFFGFWFPFYHEIKILFVLWLLLPVTKGSSIMYRKVIHPLLLRREQEIDELISKAKDQGYNVILDFGCKSVSLATTAIMNTAVKNAPPLLSSTALESRPNRNVKSKRTERVRQEPETEPDGCEQCDDAQLYYDEDNDDARLYHDEDDDDAVDAEMESVAQSSIFEYTDQDERNNDKNTDTAELDQSYVPDVEEEYYTLRKRPRKSRKRESSVSSATSSRRTTRSSTKNKRH